MTSCKCCDRESSSNYDSPYQLDCQLTPYSVIRFDALIVIISSQIFFRARRDIARKGMGNDENNISLCSVYKICLISIIVGRMNCVCVCINFMTQHINDAKDENGMMRDRLNERRLFDGKKCIISPLFA